MKNLICLFVSIAFCNCGMESGSKSGSSNEASSYYSDSYQDFTIDEVVAAYKMFLEKGWAKNPGHEMGLNGEITRYLFLHFSEFWPHAVIKKGNPHKNCL